MSETIDERIVQLKIENNQFESEANKTMGTLNKLSSSFSEFGKNGENVAKQLDSVQSSISKSVDKFSAGVDKMDVSKKMGSIKGSLVSGASDIKNSFEKLEKSFDRINVFKKLDGISTNAFSNLKQDVKQAEVSMQQFGNSVEATANYFSTLRIIGVDTMVRLARHAEDMAVNLAKSLSVDQVKAGLNEYESKLDTIQVILANTQGANSLEEVKDRLEELNRYADKTIYNFGQMTQNIGRFTAAGVGLDDSVTAIKGLSNLSALVGANAEQNSRAMYNLSQALSVGKMQLLDWRSFENAGGLGGKVFRDELIKTADALGYFNKEWSSGSGMSSTSLSGEELKNQAMGIGGAFRETLKYGWVDNEVMIQTLQRFSDETTELGQRAYEAATQVRTFSKLMDTLKESVQSGWAESMEHIFGDYEEAPKVWTKLNEVIGGYLEKQAQARNADLEAWSQNGGRDNVIKGIANSYEILTTALDKLRSAFDNVFDTSRLDLLNRFSEGFANATGNLLALFKGANVINDPLEQLNNAISSLEKTNYGSSFIERGIDVKQHVIDQLSTNGGYNIGNLKNILERDAIKWTDTLKEANKAALDSWGKNPLTGSYSITDLQAMTLDTIEGQLTVSVSPMLQTENGSEYLDRQTVTDYVNSIIDKAFSDAGSLSWEERTDQLFKLDKLGTVINDKEIKGLFGFVDIFSGSDEDAKKYIKQIDAVSDAYAAFKEIVRTGDTTIDIAYSTPPVEVPKDDKSTARKAIKEIKQQQKETSKLAKTMERLGDSVSGIDTKPLEDTTEIFGELVKNKNLSQKDIREAMGLVTDTVSERSSGLTRQQIALMDKQLEALRNGKDSGSVAAEIIKQNHDVTNSIRNLTEEEKHLKVPEELFDNSVEGRLSRAKSFSSKFGIVFEDIMSMVKEVLGMLGQIRRTAKTVFSAVFGGIDDGIAWMEVSNALHGFLNTVHQVVDYIENYVAQGDTYNKLREMAAGIASFFSMMAKIKILKWKIIFRGIQFLVENLLPPLVDFLHVIGRGLNEVNGALGRFDITGKIYDLFDMILNSKGASLVIDGIKAILSLLSQIASLTFTGVTNLIDSLNNFSMPNIGKGFKNFFGGIRDSFSDFSAEKEKLANDIAGAGVGIGAVIVRSLDRVFGTEVAAAELGEEAEKTDEAIDKAVGGIKKTVTSIPGRIESSFGLAEGTLAEKADSFADAIHGIPKKIKRALGKDTSESDNYILGLTPDGITAAFDSITGAMLTPAELEARINDAFGGVKDYVLREKDGIVAAFDAVSGEMLTAEEYAKRAHKGLDGLTASIKEYITAIPTNIKNKALDITSSIGRILYGTDTEGAEKTNLMLERVSHAFDKVREAYQKVKTFLFGNSDEGKLGIFSKAWTKAFEFFTNEKIQNGVKGFFGFIRDKLSIAYNAVTGFFKAGENGEASRFSQTIGKVWEKLKEFFTGDAFREHIESTKNLFKALGKALLDFFSSGTFNKIANGFLIVGNAIKNFVIWIFTSDAIRGFFGAIVDGISNLYHSAKESEAFKNVMQSLGHIIVSLAGAIGKLAKSEGFKSFLSVAGKLLGGLIMTVDKIISSDVFKSAAGLIGDFFSSIFIGIDKLMSSDGLAQAGQAISDFFGSTGKTLEGLSTGEVKPDFSFLTGKDGTFGIIPMIKGAFSAIMDYLASIDLVAIWKGFTGIISNIWSGFLDAFRGHEVGAATMDEAVEEGVEALTEVPKNSAAVFGKNIGDLANAIGESLGNAGKEVFGAVSSFFSTIGDHIQSGVMWLTDQLSNPDSPLWSWFKGLGALTSIRLGNSMAGVFSSIKNLNKGFLGAFNTFGEIFKSKEFADYAKGFFDSFKMNGPIGAMKELFTKMKDEKWFSLDTLTQPFSKGLNKFFARLPRNIAKGMGNLLKPLKVFSKGFNKFFGDLGKGVESFLTNFGKGMKGALRGFGWEKTGEGVKSFAIAIGILVASIAALILLPQEGVQKAIDTIRDLGVMLVMFTGIMAWIAKKSGIFGNAYSKGGVIGGFVDELFGRDDPSNKLLKVGIGLLAMGSAIALIARAASSLDKLGNPIVSIFGVAYLVKTVAQSMALLGDKKGLFAAGTGMMVMAIAINMLIRPLRVMHDMLSAQDRDLGAIIGAYIGLIGELFAAAGSMALLGNKKGLFSAGIGLLFMAFAMGKITKAIQILGRLPYDELVQGLSSVGAVFGSIAVVVWALDFAKVTKIFRNLLALGVGMNFLATSLLALSIPIGIIAGLDWVTNGKVAFAVEALLTAVAAFAGIATAFSGLEVGSILKNLSALALGIALLSGAMMVVMVPVTALSLMKVEKLAQGMMTFLGAISIIAIIASELDGALKVFMNLASLAAGIAILGAAFVPITTIFIAIGDQLNEAMSGFAMLTGLTAFVAILGKAITPAIIVSIFEFAVALSAVAAAVYLFAAALDYLMNGKVGGFGAVEVSAAEMTSDVGKTVPKNLNVSKPVAKSGKKTAQAYTKPMNQIPKVTKTIGEDSAEALNEGFEDGLDSFDTDINDYVDSWDTIDAREYSDFYNTFNDYAAYGESGFQDAFDHFTPDMSGFTDGISDSLYGSMDSVYSEFSNYTAGLFSGGEGTDLISNMLGGSGLDTIAGNFDISGIFGKAFNYDGMVTVNLAGMDFKVPDDVNETLLSQIQDAINNGGTTFDENGNPLVAVIEDQAKFLSGEETPVFDDNTIVVTQTLDNVLVRVIPDTMEVLPIEFDREEQEQMRAKIAEEFHKALTNGGKNYDENGNLTSLIIEDTMKAKEALKAGEKLWDEADPPDHIFSWDENGVVVELRFVPELDDFAIKSMTDQVIDFGTENGKSYVNGLTQGISEGSEMNGVGGMLARMLGLESEDDLYTGIGEVASGMASGMIKSMESSIAGGLYGLLTGTLREIFGDQPWIDELEEKLKSDREYIKENGGIKGIIKARQEIEENKAELDKMMTEDPDLRRQMYTFRELDHMRWDFPEAFKAAEAEMKADFEAMTREDFIEKYGWDYWLIEAGSKAGKTVADGVSSFLNKVQFSSKDLKNMTSKLTEGDGIPIVYKPFFGLLDFPTVSETMNEFSDQLSKGNKVPILYNNFGWLDALVSGTEVSAAELDDTLKGTVRTAEKSAEEIAKVDLMPKDSYEAMLRKARESEEELHSMIEGANEAERQYSEELAGTADESLQEMKDFATGAIDALTGVHEVGAAELDENPFEGIIVAMDESTKDIKTASESLDESFFGSDGLAQTVEKAFKFLSSVGGVFGSLFNASEITDSWLNPVEPVEVQFHEISPQEQKASEAMSNSYPKNPTTIGQEDGNAYLDGVEQTVTERGPETGTIVRSIFDTDAAEKGSSSAESFTIGAKAKLSESSDVLGTTVFSIFDNEENTSRIQNAGAALADNLTTGYEAKSEENADATGQAAVDNLVSGIGGADKTTLQSTVKDLITETAAGATTGESETALTNAGEQSSEKITNAFKGKYPQQAPEAGKGFTQSLAGGVTEEATTGASLPNAAQAVDNSLLDNTRTKLDQDAPKVGEFAVAGIANGTATPNAKQMLIDAGFGIGGGLLDAVNQKLGIASPSKEFGKVAGFSIDGLVNRVKENLPIIAAAGTAMGDMLLSSYQSTAAQVDYVLNNDIQPTITPVLDLTRIQNGANYVNSMFQGRNAIDIVSDANLNFDRAFMANKQLQIDAAKGVDVINYREDFKALNDKLSDLGEAMSNMQWVTDTGAVIGAFQSPMNKALGFSSMKANRGL